jgi:hypothetical protein
MKASFLLLLTFLVLFFSNCTHYYYAPNMHNVPMLKEKNDSRVIMAQSNGGEISSTEIQAAYAITDKIGLMGNAMFARSKPGDAANPNRGSGTLAEIGVGYYKPLKKQFVFETYAGLGGAGIRNTFSNGLTIKTTAIRLFVQPEIGYSMKYFDAILSTRVCGVNLSKPGTYSGLDSTNTANLDYLSAHPFSLLVEPAITLRGGWGPMKVQFQYGLSSNLTSPKLSQGTSNVSLGLYFDLGILTKPITGKQ